MMQVEIVTATGSQFFQPQNGFESYHAVVYPDDSVDVVVTAGTADGSPRDETIVAHFTAGEVDQVIESSAG